MCHSCLVVSVCLCGIVRVSFLGCLVGQVLFLRLGE